MSRARNVNAAVVAAAVCCALVAAVATAVVPSAALGGAALALVVAVAWAARRVLAAPAAAAAGAVVVLGAALALAVWPVTSTLVAIVAAVLLLAARAPAWALAAGVLLIGLEGSIKILLGLEPTPLPFSSRAVGAAAIDIALFGAIAGVVAVDRLRTPRALWGAAGRAERVALLLVGAWLALSVVQIAQGGDLARGIEGFRLFQAYCAVAIAAAIVAWRRPPAHVLAAGLALGGAIALYAAVRVAIGASDAELRFALSVPTTVAYGQAVRAVGSFSSAVGLGSFLTPVVIVGAVAGLLLPRVRVAAWIVAGLAAIGVLGSYGRAPLLGIVAGVLFAVCVVAVAADVPRRRKLTVAAAVAIGLGALYGGLLVASAASPQLRDRAKVVTDPFGDESLNMRLDNWGERVAAAGDRPLGRGVGTIGGASAEARKDLETTDNSFLKVLLEQGFLGAALFLGGLLAVIVLSARRLAGIAGEARAVGVAALAGFVGFLALSVSGEYVEQPGKVLAWALLGVAVALGLRNRPATEAA